MSRRKITRHYGRREFRRAQNGVRMSFGLVQPDATWIPTQTAPGPVETTRGLSVAQEREARKIANREARLKAAAESVSNVLTSQDLGGRPALEALHVKIGGPPIAWPPIEDSIVKTSARAADREKLKRAADEP